MRRKKKQDPEEEARSRAADDIAASGGRLVWAEDGAEMILVPAGPFFQGREPGDIFAPEGELPGRVVHLRPYLIDRAPITNAQFARFVKAGGYVDPHPWVPAGWAWRMRAQVEAPRSFATAGFDAPDQPVGGVSWYEASAYARWARKELPTESQWEKAARGGADRRLFPWGEELPRSGLLNFNGNLGRTSPAGAFPSGASPYGVVDMAGNVNNWCRDWFWPGFYRHCAEQGIERDPCLDDALRMKLSLAIQERSDRGGGFATSFACFEALTTCGRLSWPPDRREPWNGFRCVVEL